MVELEGAFDLTGGDQSDERVRLEWEAQLVGRFPFLKGRVKVLPVPGGVAGGSLRDEATIRLFRDAVVELLEIPSEPSQP